MKILHQFYYTNYGRGYRIEASSIPDLGSAGSVVSAVQAMAGAWESDLSREGTETVSFSEKTGRYAGARTVPCRQPGDSRPGFWSHVILPEKDGSDGFAACLSWPADRWETHLRLRESLEDVVIPQKEYDLQKICRKYGLGRKRLAQLILLALKSASGDCRPASLICRQDDVNACIGSAREMMMLIYQLLPDALRHRAGYQVPVGKAGSALRFYFCRSGSGQDGFFLDPQAAATEDPDTLAQEMGQQLADLLLTDPDQYQRRIRTLCSRPEEDFETILWNHFRQLTKRELENLPQNLLAGNAARLLRAAEYDAGLDSFMEDWFSAVRMDTSDPGLGGFTELSLQEAQLLNKTDSKDYRRCIQRCRELLQELSHDKVTLRENLRIIGRQYPVVAMDLADRPWNVIFRTFLTHRERREKRI